MSGRDERVEAVAEEVAVAFGSEWPVERRGQDPETGAPVYPEEIADIYRGIARRVLAAVDAVPDRGPRIESSGQWCLIHDIHQDDPRHAYDSRVCEGHHRLATPQEEARLVADAVSQEDRPRRLDPLHTTTSGLIARAERAEAERDQLREARDRAREELEVDSEWAAPQLLDAIQRALEVLAGVAAPKENH